MRMRPKARTGAAGSRTRRTSLSPTATLTDKGEPVDVKQIGRELGVRYMLEGSVPRSIAVTRSPSRRPAHVWADQFDGQRGKLRELWACATCSKAASTGRSR